MPSLLRKCCVRVLTNRYLTVANREHEDSIRDQQGYANHDVHGRDELTTECPQNACAKCDLNHDE
jgi:hypothetical protein